MSRTSGQPAPTTSARPCATESGQGKILLILVSVEKSQKWPEGKRPPGQDYLLLLTLPGRFIPFRPGLFK